MDTNNNTHETPQEDARLRELESQLRRLPRPDVPAGLAERLLERAPARRRRSHLLVDAWPWAGAVAAAAAVVAAVALLAPERPAPRTAEQSQAPAALAALASPAAEEDIVLAIEREGRAARMLAMADILDRQPAGRQPAEWNRRYVQRAYGETRVARNMNQPPTPATAASKENSNG